MNIVQLVILFLIVVFYFGILTTPSTSGDKSGDISKEKPTTSIFSKLNLRTRLQKEDLLKKVTPNVHFMTKQETRYFIKHDRDKFITGLDELNLKARGVKIPETYIKITSKAATNFTEEEQKLLFKAINIACEKLDNTGAKELKRYGIDKRKMWEMLQTWTLAKTKDKVLEMGMPHTREDIIFLSGYYLAVNSDDINKLVRTMIHEFIHIYQRKYSEEYKAFLKDHEWEIHPYNENDKRINPDLDDNVWKRPAQKGEASTKATRLEAGGYKIFIAKFKNRDPMDLKDIDLNDSRYEHPYEYYAYNLSTLLTKNTLL
jgi:hypothetical protein